MTDKTRDHRCPSCDSFNTDLDGRTEVEDIRGRTIMDCLHECHDCGTWWWDRWTFKPTEIRVLEGRPEVELEGPTEPDESAPCPVCARPPHARVTTHCFEPVCPWHERKPLPAG